DSKRLLGRGRFTDNRRWRGVIRVWDLASATLHDHDVDHAVWVGWSPHGEPLAGCGEGGGLRIPQPGSGPVRRFACSDLGKPEQSSSLVCVLAADGKTLAVADWQPRLHVWDSPTGREHCTMKPRDYIRSLALSSDGQRLASLTRERQVELWDAQ